MSLSLPFHPSKGQSWCCNNFAATTKYYPGHGRVRRQGLLTIQMLLNCIKCREKRNTILPLSVGSLVSAVATQCQEGRMMRTGGGMARWHCPQRPFSSLSGPPLTEG